MAQALARVGLETAAWYIGADARSVYNSPRHQVILSCSIQASLYHD